MALLSKDEFLAQLEPTSGVAIAPDQDCPVCYEPIVESTLTSCRHVFCFECLKQWLTSSHTCPSCRHELYEKPADDEDDDDSEGEEYDDDDDDSEDEEDEDEDEEDEESDDEEWEDDDGEEQVLEWPEFDFDYDEQAVRQALQAHLETNINDKILICSLQSQAFTDYDKLLTTAVAGVVACIWDHQYFRSGSSGPEFLQGWKAIASAIQSVLSRLRQQTISGSYLFLALEKEVQQTLRTPDNQSLFRQKNADDKELRTSYLYLEVGITAVLRQVVHAGYEANPAAGQEVEHEVTELVSAYTHVPYVVHPHDFHAACQQHTKHVEIATTISHQSLAIDTQGFISKALLLPPLLASAQKYGPALAAQLVLEGKEDLVDVYLNAVPIVVRACTHALITFNGDTVAWAGLLVRLERISLRWIAAQEDWPEADRFANGFEEKHAKVLEMMKNDLYILLLPCVLVAIRLHDESQLPPVNAASNANTPPTIGQSSE